CWSSALGYQCCQGCNVISLEEDGNKWGVENGEWCGIQEDICQSKEDPCQNSEYGCCKSCNQYYVDYTGRYGYENGQWCLVKNSC
ncbi:Non-catalytic module family DOC2, partial [Piromyces sp. E2]